MTLPLVSLPSQAGGFAASMRFALHLFWSSLAALDNSEASGKTIMDYRLYIYNRISVMMRGYLDKEDL